MFKIDCPECMTELKSAKSPEPGKKIKCPKCGMVFLPRQAPREAKVSAPPQDPEEGTYRFVEDQEEQEKESKKQREEAIGPVKDRRPKSARGPALAICQKPSNQMLATSSFSCASCIITAIVLVWPMVFTYESFDTFPNWLGIGYAAFAFVWFGLIAVGAVKMQNVESYAWAMSAAIMTVVPVTSFCVWASLQWLEKLVISMLGPGFSQYVFMLVTLASGWAFFLGIFNVLTLRKPEVLAGFQEERQPDV